VIYCATSYAGALLEILVHAGTGALPGAHHAVTIDVPGEVPIERLEPGALPGWDAPDERTSRAFGDRWLAEARTAVLVVPSVVAAPHERNLLVNPGHPDARRLVVSAPVVVRWDPRLFAGGGRRGEER
jgi:RES domain-containing protein